MTCRHAPGDPNCSKSAGYARRIREEKEDRTAKRLRAEETTSKKIRTEKMEREYIALQERVKDLESQLANPDNTKYKILDFYRNKQYLALRIQYPNCTKCSYEGTKILVFSNITEIMTMNWKKIDPHFREPNEPNEPNGSEPPSPIARFPANTQGWEDAIAYIGLKIKLET